MNINQLQYFVSVAEYRSFTQAAEVHYITQTAITLQIRSLEESLGVALIDRKKRPIELTPAGNVFLREAKAILSRMEDAVARTLEASHGMVGTLRIGYEKGYERSDLSDRLRRFHRQYPNILFTCVRLDTDTMATKLLSDELDIIFGWDGTNLRQRTDIDGKLIERSPFVAALYQGHPLSNHASLKREDLKHETLLYTTASETGDAIGDAHFIQLYEKAGYRPNILLKSNEIESVLMMVAAEEGITILPQYAIAKMENAEHLVFVPIEGEGEFEEIFVQWKKDSENAALELFLNYLNYETA